MLHFINFVLHFQETFNIIRIIPSISFVLKQACRGNEGQATYILHILFNFLLYFTYIFLFSGKKMIPHRRSFNGVCNQISTMQLCDLSKVIQIINIMFASDLGLRYSTYKIQQISFYCYNWYLPVKTPGISRLLCSKNFHPVLAGYVIPPDSSFLVTCRTLFSHLNRGRSILFFPCTLTS